MFMIWSGLLSVMEIYTCSCYEREISFTEPSVKMLSNFFSSSKCQQPDSVDCWMVSDERHVLHIVITMQQQKKERNIWDLWFIDVSQKIKRLKCYNRWACDTCNYFTSKRKKRSKSLFHNKIISEENGKKTFLWWFDA